ncbi:glycoside hydrolase family 19 protein [Ruegeria sp. HKCCA4812]|uniref:glycoside hydrolase family 19 protein n=1 Tax=Ruegeria sp. HKCCA4812 TaxID=2682993 RepID=UPI001C2C3E9A|nr:glycoside hydrolase family 19 protein [Ruegeria sp. HKCCA4812]
MDLDRGDTRLIIDECAKEGLLRNQAAYVLATTRWETAHTMKPVREAYWLSEEWRRRNLRYYPYYGRGYVQLTWRGNYVHAGSVFGRDLARNPDAVMEPELATKILVRGSKEGWFTGRKLSDYINSEKTDWKGARRVINGTDKAAQIAELAAKYDAALAAEGYGKKTSTNIFETIIGLIQSLLSAITKRDSKK